MLGPSLPLVIAHQYAVARVLWGRKLASLRYPACSSITEIVLKGQQYTPVAGSETVADESTIM